MEWWEELWRSQFNCSATNRNDSEVDACDANLTSFHAITKIRSSFISYLIDAVYALEYALDGIYNCSSAHGKMSVDHCPSLQPFVKGSECKNTLEMLALTV